MKTSTNRITSGAVTAQPRIKQKQKCTYCPKLTFSSGEKFKEHMSAVHNILRPFICNEEITLNGKTIQCLKQFKILSNLNQHIKLSHYSEKRYALKSHTDKVHSSAKPFACVICKQDGKIKLFKAGASLRRHLSEKHTSSKIEIRPWCKLCNSSFLRKSDYKKHLGTKIHASNLVKYQASNSNL